MNCQFCMVHLTLYLAQEIKHWKQEMKRKNNLCVHENLPTAQKNMQVLQRHTSLMRKEMSKPLPSLREFIAQLSNM
jgi:hypothetical protein